MANGAIGVDHLRVDVLTVGDLTTAGNGDVFAKTGGKIANIIRTGVAVFTRNLLAGNAYTIKTDITHCTGVSVVTHRSVWHWYWDTTTLSVADESFAGSVEDTAVGGCSLADTINTDIPNRAGVAIVAGGSIRSTTCILAV